MSGSPSVRRFVCGACGYVHVAWAPRCASCSAHGLSLAAEAPAPVLVQAIPGAVQSAPQPPQEDLSFRPPESSRLRLVRDPLPEPELSPEELVDIADDVVVVPSSSAPVPITEIAETSFVRDSTGLAPLDNVLGGGLVAASVVLLASPPGIGKSSLTLQMLAGLGHRCLYVTGEETREQIAGTARRIGALTPRLFVLCERDLAKILAHARAMRAQTIAIDSIQKMICQDVNGRAGSPGQLKECTARLVTYAKSNDTALWLIGHVTGDGDVAGPRTIEHDVDVLLELSQGAKFEGNERILTCSNKNRFGATNVTGRFELTAKGFVAVDADGWNEEL